MRDQAIAKHRRPRKRTTQPESRHGEWRRRRISLRSTLRAVSLLTYLVILILAAWLLYYSVESPYFTIREIGVSGTKLLDPAQVRDTAGVLGSNAVLVQEGAVEQAVMRLTTARTAHAVVTLSGRVTVNVTERVPVVQWQTWQGTFLVDREGVAFSQQNPPGPLPTVIDIDGPLMEVGSRVDPSVLASVQTLQGVLPTRANIQPTWYEYSRSDGISVYVADGPRVIFGDASDLESKLSALAAISGYLETNKSRAALIDLRFKDRPVYVLAPSAPTKPGQTR